MKKQIFTLILAMMASAMVMAQSVPVTVDMGAGYANDVFYSMENGEVASVERATWDLGFYTSPWSAGIIINDGSGVELYTYPNSDTNGWATVDTTGLSGWAQLNNSADQWEDGAFNRNALGHPDYGWGSYNMVNHNVIGDSIYIVKGLDGNYYKIWIVKKISIENTFIFRFGPVDNSSQVEITLDVNPYAAKNFVYYSLGEQKVLDREPASDTWDIVFAKYMGDLGGGIYYPVTGVLNNVPVAANKFTEVGPDYDDWTAMPMDTAKSPVGYDWKEFSMGTFSWVVFDSIAYFVQTLNSDVYKLVFTDFEGTSTGILKFEKRLASPSDIWEPALEVKALELYPNPASSDLTIRVPEINGTATLEVMTMAGQLVLSETLYPGVSSDLYRLSVQNFEKGLYVMRIRTAQTTWTGKVSIIN